MTARAYIRVTMAEDGKTTMPELMVDGVKALDMSPVELIEFVMQATSALRYSLPQVRQPRP